MAEATALLEDACSAAVEGQGASSDTEIREAAAHVLALSNVAISVAQNASDLFAE